MNLALKVVQGEGRREGSRWRREGEAQANHLTPGLYDMYACTLTIYALLGQINVFFYFVNLKSSVVYR